jgi:hypothetical protein
MRRTSKLFTEEEKKRIIEETVHDVETNTSAEIVPVAATASGRYDRPEDIVSDTLRLTEDFEWLADRNVDNDHVHSKGFWPQKLCEFVHVHFA